MRSARPLLSGTLLVTMLAAACGSPPAAQAPQSEQVVVPPAPANAQLATGDAVEAQAKSQVPVHPTDPFEGPSDAPVTMVVFTDLQCPFCARAHETVRELRRTYGDKLRVVYKQNPLPFHKNAARAAEVGLGVHATAGDEAYVRYVTTVFARQDDMSDDALERHAIAAGASPKELAVGLERKKWSAKVEADLALAKELGVTGTPAFFVNGISVVGAQPLERFKSTIEAELAAATEALAAGTPRDRIYLARTNENFRAKAAAPEDEEEEAPDTAVYRVPVGTSPVRGPKDAAVTVVVFSDFQCPFCKRVEPTLDRLAQAHPKDVRIVWKHQPLSFHPRAVPAAHLAIEARAQKGDEGFWKAHDLLFESAPKLEDADLRDVAKRAGLNVDRAMAAVLAKKHQTIVDQDVDLADDVQASGTPHFFINGKRLVGAQPYDKFEELVRTELAHANDLVARGVKPGDVYETIIKDGRTADYERKNVAVPPNAPSRGPANAPVTVQIFSDFQCPFCKRSEATIAEVEKHYGRKVRFVWRNLPLPFHKDAKPAAVAALEARRQKGDRAFWAMHAKLFENQRDGGLERAALERYAKDLGLNATEFAAALDGTRHEDAIKADMDAAEAAGIRGTPGFVVNGYFISGAQPFPRFRKVIDRALADASPKRR
jgi:protein-disulfide isomerase